MGTSSTFTPTDIAYYERLIFKTASMYVSYVEEDFDDIQQVLRIKVWRALEAYDARRSKMPVDRFVFSCVKNQCKDLVKKKRRNLVYLEDVGHEGRDGEVVRDAFEARYLTSDAHKHFGRVEDAAPLIPSTLTAVEREVLALLYLDFTQKEAQVMLGVSRNDMERAVRGIRDKMADWRPTAPEEPLPGFEEGASCPLPIAA